MVTQSDRTVDGAGPHGNTVLVLVRVLVLVGEAEGGARASL